MSTTAFIRVTLTNGLSHGVIVISRSFDTAARSAKGHPSLVRLYSQFQTVRGIIKPGAKILPRKTRAPFFHIWGKDGKQIIITKEYLGGRRGGELSRVEPVPVDDLGTHKDLLVSEMMS